MLEKTDILFLFDEQEVYFIIRKIRFQNLKMPARKKRSKAATQREQNKKRNDSESEIVDISLPGLQNGSVQNKQGGEHYSVVSGTIHQGDVRFQYPGVQCTFISFWALVLMENKSPHLWNSTDIDFCIVDGNDRFIKHCFKTEIQPRQILVKELPQSTDAYNSFIRFSQSDSTIKVGTLNQPTSVCETNAVFISIEKAILGCFHRFISCFLVCGGQTIAIAKRQNRFFVFDSHSRGKDGFLHHNGSAVLVSFNEIWDLISFLKHLFIESLRLKPSEQFELVPVTISKLSYDIYQENESLSSVVDSSLNTELEFSCKESNISNTNEQAANITIARESSSVPNQKIAALHEEGVQSYLTDQKKHDTEYRQTSVFNHSSDVSKRATRIDYMRVYMQRRRNDDSFRKKSNAVSLKCMQKMRETEEGRLRLNKQATESKQHMLGTDEGKQKLKRQSAERKKKMLSTEEGKLKHNQRSAEGMKQILSTEEGRKRHQEQSKETWNKMLSTKEGRLKFNKRSAEGMKTMLSSEEGRLKHRKRSAEGMKKMLSSEGGRLKHRKRSAERMKTMLSTDEGRLKHRKRSAEGMKKMLSTDEGRLKHRKRSAEGKKKMLSSEEGRLKHRKRSVEGMRKTLITEAGRQKHNQRSTEGMKKMRMTDEARQKDRKRSAKRMKNIRETEKGRLENRRRTLKAIREKRGADEKFKERERIQKRKRRLDDIGDFKQRESFNKRKRRESSENEYLLRKKRKLGFSFTGSIAKFTEAVSQSVSYVCSCCHQVWFKHSVKEVSVVNRMSAVNKSLLNKCVTGYLSVENCEWICSTCIYNIRRDKVPKLAVINGMKFPDRPPELNLNNLEERLISLRIPFMQIRVLNSGGQFSLKGSVVNVPAEIEPTIRALPRLQNKSETIPVKLKRMKEFKHAVATENIRPVAVMTALQTLMNSSDLYKKANISIDEKWNSKMEPDFEDQPMRHNENDDDESGAFSETDDEENPVVTLLDEQSVDKNAVVSVAPGEGQKPVSIFKDPDAEYLAFPTIFCGEKRIENSERLVPVYYSDICKWELRCVDRRAGLHIPNIFYKMKKLQTEQICNKVRLAVRRCKTKGKCYSAGFILKDNMGESLVKLDEGYKIFRTIRNSPQYWENQKKEVFAMIRQLGLPTLFISLSANDLHWPELIIALGKLVDNKDYTEEVESKTLSWETRSRLVQSDPVTCVRHFDHRVSQFIDLVLKSPESPLGVLEDYFYRVEFQQRGSPHIHMLAWIENSPKYKVNTDAEVLDYIDQVSSCSAAVASDIEEYLDFQKHRHSRTCRKGGKPVCRFGIPFPPMRKTTIIGPYVGEDRSVYQEYYKRIQKYLTNLERDITFDEFLEEIKLAEEDYIMAVQTSLKTEKIFLERRPIESRINPYMKDLLDVWKANHDIQFVLDAYACATYIVSYINKSARGNESVNG